MKKTELTIYKLIVLENRDEKETRMKTSKQGERNSVDT